MSQTKASGTNGILLDHYSVLRTLLLSRCDCEEVESECASKFVDRVLALASIGITNLTGKDLGECTDPIDYSVCRKRTVRVVL